MTQQVASHTPGERPRFRLSLRAGMWICIIVGILVSGYLTYVKLAAAPVICVANGSFDCETVQNSVYSKFMGIPIAYLGLATYLGLAALLLLEKRIPFLAANGKMLLFGIVLFAWMYSMYLVYLQVFVLQALCQWCLTHEIAMTVLFVLVSIQMWRELRD